MFDSSIFDTFVALIQYLYLKVQDLRGAFPYSSNRRATTSQ
jgi:hypothetical protein